MNIFYINLVSVFDFYRNIDAPKNIENIKSLIRNRDNKVILAVLYEPWPPEKILSILRLLEVSLEQDNIILLIDQFCYDDSIDWGISNIIVCDSMVNVANKVNIPPDNPNLDIDKFLLLVGKPYKKQRIFTLYDIYQRDKLDSCEWSFHYKKVLDDKIRCFLPNITDEQYLKFVHSASRSIDDINPLFAGDSVEFMELTKSPSAEVFSKASISLISETYLSRDFPSFITEKTWKTVINLHPFVLIGYKESYEYLESLGIDTFQYIVKHPYSKLIGEEEDVIKMCNDNVLHMLANKDSFREELTNSVFHNRAVFEKIASAYDSKLHPYITNIVWDTPYLKVKGEVSNEVYQSLWGKTKQ
jgi:hypothetical protein